MIPVQVGPAIVLGVGEFHVLRFHRLGHFQDLLDVIDVMPVQHAIQHHRVLVLLDQLRNFLLEIESAGARQEIVQFLGRVLEGQLDVIQAAFLEGADALFVEPHAGGDQVGVIAKLARFSNQDFEVVAHQWLAAGKAQLRCADLAALPQHAQPVLGRQLLAVGRVVHRVVAEHAVQRTAVRDLRQQPERVTRFFWDGSSLFHVRAPES